MSTPIFPYDELTDAERHEFNTWIDSCKAEVRDPLPEDFGYAEQIAYDQWKDETTESITDDEIDDIQRQEVAYQQSLYQAAKARFDTLHPFSQPDSLTRRGTMLIARRKLTIDQARNGAIEDWRGTINRLFSNAVTIFDIDIDHKRNLRVRFTPHTLVQLHDGSYCINDPSDVDYLSWCAERRVGG